MPEIPPEAVRAVAEILRAWEVDGSGEGDLGPVEEFDDDARELLEAAAPLLVAHGAAVERARIAAEGRRTRARIVCPVCTHEVVKRDDGKPIRHWPPPGREDLACDTHTRRGHCRGSCRCRRHP